MFDPSQEQERKEKAKENLEMTTSQLTPGL